MQKKTQKTYKIQWFFANSLKKMTKINKFFRNNLYQFILAIIVLITILILNFYSVNKNSQKKKLFESFENIYLKKTFK